ncbi:formate dehydrogenase accessory sulfurtransferase FdhD [Thauera humireducens]|uniref:Sulfur carrier protein FdhD n=1 Tax=Thauera humireducens TaxID=1134435 RepID=A0A127K8L6_9RHOO|nr:formate dehydrogenase accessory sulfurtransferase FdhD [Thauera humireducens]AMO38262.1 sufurtransferase FdhD [Thauera humireducens]
MLEPPARSPDHRLANACAADEAMLPHEHVTVTRSTWTGPDPLSAHEACETLIEETPVALVYNGISHAVMLATPSDLEDFAYGFSLTEGIVSRRQDIYGMDIVSVGQGIEVRIELAAEHFVQLKHRRRTLAGRTGCGLCGVDSLAAALRPVATLEHRSGVSRAALARALDELGQEQVLHRLTGGAHAAAWVSASGQVQLVREDVGRHNALDKLIGAQLRWGNDPRAGFVLVTSRASYEMVHKTAAAGIGCLAAVSAPTAHAVRLAESAGLTLVGFARGQRCTAYTFPDTITA